MRLSTGLTTSATCIVAVEHDITPRLEKLYRAMGQELPRTKRILELNPEHALVTGLRTTHEANADDPALAEATELLYGTALLAGGSELADPPRLTHLLADRLICSGLLSMGRVRRPSWFVPGRASLASSAGWW